MRRGKFILDYLYLYTTSSSICCAFKRIMHLVRVYKEKFLRGMLTLYSIQSLSLQQAMSTIRPV